VYVPDQNNNRIQKFNSTGAFVSKFGSSGSGNGQFTFPQGVAVDSSGNIYVADTFNDHIQKFNSTGNFITKSGAHGSRNGYFNIPSGVAINSSGALYVADSSNNRIQKFDPAVTYTPIAGFTGSDNFTYTISDGNSGNDTATVSVNVIQRCNTTDHFGYTCKDSNFQAGPTFSWTDITSTGTRILADADDTAVNNIPIGFPFSFYEQTYSQISISSNGMSLVNESSTEFDNQPIGSSDLPNNFIAPFWDDLITLDSVGAGEIYYQTIGTAPNRTFVVEWFNVQGSPITSSGATFEAILNEGTNEIRFQYLDVNFGEPKYDSGVSATVGIESGDGRGLQYSFDEAVLYDNLVVRFTGPSVSAPNAFNDSAVTSLNIPVTIDVLSNDSDFNNDPLIITSVTHGANGIVTNNSDDLTYTPNTGFTGTNTFTYTISDGHGGNDTATVTVLVTAANNPPIAVNDSVLTKVNNAVAIDVLVNDTDSDGDTLTISSVKQAGNGIVTIDTGFLTKWGLGNGNGEFASPNDLAVDAFGNLYVVDTENNRIQKFDSSGNFDIKWGSLGSGDDQFNSPRGIAVDSSGNVYVADTNNNRIQKFDSEGVPITRWGSFGSGNGQFKIPQDVALDSSGNVYVTDTLNDRIQKFTSSGTFLTKWGSSGISDGQLKTPLGIVVYSSSNIYVSDSGNNRIQKFGNTGTFITKWGSFGTSNGTFNNPRSLALDGSGNIYVVDSLNHRIQKFTNSG
ncbi:MAG: Ig-like domain-containing protein, partial [Nitrososphaerales archaeon]